jgi:Leucine-rich repeat (LRR) protein
VFDWTVPTTLFDFPNLEELDLSENYIMVLPEAIKNLKKLKCINLE